MKLIVTAAVFIFSATVFMKEASAACSRLGDKCVSGSFRRDPDDCNLFCHCAHQKWVQKRCPRGLYFDEEHNICNWPDQIPMCEPPQGLCDNDPCANGGTCMLTRGSYTCSCLPGFGGVDCLLRKDACSTNPCQNGGRCRTTRDNMAECDCPPSTAGEFCQDTTCPRYSCPRNVTSFNYPDWQDRTCRSFFTCQFGVLENRLCSGDSVFSFITLQCVQPARLEYPCTLNFVDSQF